MLATFFVPGHNIIEEALGLFIALKTYAIRSKFSKDDNIFQPLSKRSTSIFLCIEKTMLVSSDIKISRDQVPR